MDRQTTRKVRYFLGLHYPKQVTAAGNEFFGCYPDLPGCSCSSTDLQQLYAKMEEKRRKWIATRLLDQATVPLPNSHLEPAPKEQPAAKPVHRSRTLRWAVEASF